MNFFDLNQFEENIELALFNASAVLLLSVQLSSKRFLKNPFLSDYGVILRYCDDLKLLII